MRVSDFIQVLWVENDPVVIDAYPLEAEDYNIQLVPFSCWEDAEVALRSDYDRWDAIILDAKCQVKASDIDKAIPFLTQSISKIAEISREKNKSINWYILSGQGEDDISDAIPDTRLAWDKDWTDSKNKKFYSKESDRQILFNRIKYHHSVKEDYLITNDLYRQVFNAIENCHLNDVVFVKMLELLKPIHFKTCDNTMYNKHFTDARIIIEWIFRSMIEWGILPSSVIIKSKGKEQLNLTWSSKFLAGVPDDKSNIEIVDNYIVFPKVIADIVKNLIYLCGSKEHTCTSSVDECLNVAEHIKSVGNSPYLLGSIALQLCEVILWYDGYLRINSDPERNTLNWKCKE